MKKGRINLVSRIEENWGQLPDGDVAESGSEGFALAFVGVPIGPQESLPDLSSPRWNVAPVALREEVTCALTRSWIASFDSLFWTYPYVSRAQKCVIALGSMSMILRVPNAAGNAYT